MAFEREMGPWARQLSVVMAIFYPTLLSMLHYLDVSDTLVISLFRFDRGPSLHTLLSCVVELAPLNPVDENPSLNRQVKARPAVSSST